LTYGIDLRNGLKCHADAIWGYDLDTRRSNTGYFTKLDGNIISSLAGSHKATNRPIVATSSPEAEYLSLTAAVCWFKRMLTDLKVCSKSKVVIFQDNQEAIALAKNPIFHQRAKRIDIKYHIVREQINFLTCSVAHKPSTWPIPPKSKKQSKSCL
jgi:hypothetical protein